MLFRSDGLWRREVAAWVLSDYLGLDLVPMTVSRLDGPYAPGSLQLWIGDATDDHYFTLRERADLEDWFRRLCLFDLIANNSDRKAGHVLFDTTRCWAIDNGLCFAEDDKVRTVVWDYVGNNFSTQEISTLTRTADVDDDLFGSLLTSEEIESIRWRAHNLLEMGAFPEPDEDGEWPAYPWPLV